jgi:uncharacterized protein (DUF1330 family)
MKINTTAALALIAGAVIGGTAIQGLHAQAGPPVYVIEEIEVSSLELYLKDYAVKSTSVVNRFGGRRLVIGSGKITPIEGEPPKTRVVILRWENMDKMQTWLNSPENKEVRKIGDKYAKFRLYAVEGLPQQ